MRSKSFLPTLFAFLLIFFKTAAEDKLDNLAIGVIYKVILPEQTHKQFKFTIPEDVKDD